jgi:signal transduction histidine kinase
MAAGVSHDLRNLLNPLVLHLELADHGIEHGDSAGARDHITQMEQLLTHSVQTIERLRDYGKQAAESRLEEVDLDRLIREATKIARPRMGEPGRSRTRFAEELGAPSRFWGHAEDILSALVNLIVNAIDALTGDGTITLRSWEDAEARWVQVTDDGPGMAPEVERRVFEPFFTTKGETGTGLGLAMVDACMQRHGGAVKLETAPGQGTRITLVFPRRSDRPADRPAGQDAPPGT